MGELGDEHDNEHHSGHSCAEEVDHARTFHTSPLTPVLLGTKRTVPVQYHSDLPNREGNEDTDHVELDQGGHRSVENPHEKNGCHCQQHNPVGIGQTVPSRVELPR